MKSSKNLVFFIFVLSYFSYSIITSSEAATINLVVQTNKNNYTVGELVNVTGRVTSDGTPVSGAYVGVEVDKPDGSPIFADQVETNSVGNFSAVFRLPSDATFGVYTLSATYSGIQEKTVFNVASTAIPEFLSITVLPLFMLLSLLLTMLVAAFLKRRRIKNYSSVFL